MEETKRVEQENHFRKISFEFPGIDEITDLVKLILLRIDHIAQEVQRLCELLDEQMANESVTKVDESVTKDE